MYFKLISAKNEIDHNIVANNPEDAKKIAKDIYPDVPMTILKITQAEYQGFGKCPLCDGSMDFRKRDNTHAWFCQECPLISFEYVTDKDIDNLKELIK